jgi:MATE family multidrug resistance protein
MAIRNEAYKTWRLSGPIILGELTQIALGIIDNAMVGAISYKHLAAASLVNSVMNIPFVLGIGLTMSVSQTVSMAHGRRDGQKVSHYLFNGFWLCAIASVLIACGLHFGRDVLFHLGQDTTVAALAVPYLLVMGWSTVPMLMFMALKQFTDGLELTRTAMVLSLLALPLNIFINWLLVYGNWGFPRWELVGAGAGTLITRIIILIALAVVILLHPRFKRYIAVRKNQWQLQWRTVQELLHIGVPSSLQAGMESGAFAISGIIIGTLGAVQQAAHHVALSCAAFTFMVSLGLAQGGSIRTSNAWGRNNWKEIELIGKSTLLSGVCYGVLCAIFFVAMRHTLPLAFNTDVAVVTLTGTLMLYAAVFQISDATQAIGVGLCRGIKDVRVPTLYVALAYWVLGIPIGCLMAFTLKLGAVGMWIGFVSGLTFSSLLLNKRFFKMIRNKRAAAAPEAAL